MRVLITNDDGIESPWLHDLAGAFHAEDHHVSVIAPAANCSGMSGALAPLVMGNATDVELLRRAGVPADSAWGAVDCSPSMCTLIGLGGFLHHDIDLVVSGVNFGWNIGRDIWRSGTVWACITAWGMGVPSLAVSAAPVEYAAEHRREAVERALGVAKTLVDAPGPELWNLNFPEPPSSEWAEPVWAPLAMSERLTATSLEIIERPAEGDAIVRLGQEVGLQVAGAAGTDADLVQRGGVTLSRLRPIDAVVEPT